MIGRIFEQEGEQGGHEARLPPDLAVEREDHLGALGHQRLAYVPPVAGGLWPGDSIPWGLWVRTERLGGTRSEIRFDPGAVRVDPGESCDVARVLRMPPLPATDVVVSSVYAGWLHSTVNGNVPKDLADFVLVASKDLRGEAHVGLVPAGQECHEA